MHIGIAITQVIIIVVLLIMQKQMKDMPESVAWECNKAAELARIQEKKWKEEYVKAQNELVVLRNALISLSKETCNGKNQSDDSNKQTEEFP